MTNIGLVLKNSSIVLNLTLEVRALNEILNVFKLKNYLKCRNTMLGIMSMDFLGFTYDLDLRC